ncbi:MAG: amidohydrolase family protein [Planctomycetota bacterium]|nr:amidohydrolase family protein [Planctomycetota bacterium]
MADALTPIAWKTKTVLDAHAHYYGGEPAEHFHRLIDLANFTKANLMAITPQMNDLVLARKRERPGKYFIFGNMDHDQEKIARGDGDYLVPQIERLMERGFDGIKCLEGKPSLRKEWMPHAFDHAYYRPFFACLTKNKIPITIHTSDPLDFWTDPAQAAAYRDYHPQEEYFRQAEAILERHPDLKINFAHFLYLSPQLERLERLFERYPVFSVDLAPGGEFLYYLSDDPARARAFFLRWQERILFGTDLSDKNALKHGRAKAEVLRLFLETGEVFHNPTAAAMGRPPEVGSNGRSEIQGLDLPQAALDRIMFANFEAWVSKEPKPAA